MSNKNNGLSNEQSKLLNQAQKLAKTLGLEYNDIADAQESILSNTIKSTKELQASLVAARERLKVVREEDRYIQRSVEAHSQVKDADVEIAKLMSGIAKDKFKTAALTEEELDLTKDIVKKTKNQLLASKGVSDTLDTQISQYMAMLDKASQHIDASEKLKQNYSAINLAAINEGFDELQNRIDDLTSIMPKGLSKALGFDTLAGNLKDAALSSKKLPAGLGIVAAGAAAVALFQLLKNITDQSIEFAGQTGLTVASSQKLVAQSYSLQSSFNNQLSSQKDILAVQQELISTLGPIAQLSGDVALRVSETGKAFGYGAQEAAKVQSQMMEIGGFSQTAAIEAQEFTAQLALAEGVAPGTVMKDIAKSAAVAAKYFSGNPKALGKAAVEAAKLGTSLEQMAKTSSALLNIEQSLEDQYVASAMLGRQINFDTARRLSAEGDIVGATQEVLKELGGIEEFENASIFAKERMAAAAGMTVEELSKSLAIEERRGELSDDQLAAMSGLNLSAAEIANMSAEELRSKLASNQATEELTTSFAKIQSSLTTAILPIAKALVPVFQLMSIIVSGIALAFTPITDAATGLAKMLTFSVDGLTNMQMILGGIAGLYLVIKGYALATQIIEGIKLGYQAASMGFEQRKALLEKKGLVRNIGIAVMKAYSNLGPILGTIAAAGIAALGYTFVNDGEMSPVGPTGYSRVMSGPEGSIAFNDKDTIVAGTDLNGGGGGGGASVISKASIDALVSAIQNLKIIIDDSAVSAINKQGAVAASYR
jgi:hypothetical protein